MLMSETLIKEFQVSIHVSILDRQETPHSYSSYNLLTTHEIVRMKAQTIIDMMESPEKMEIEKTKYNQIRAQMGRPGIVDMNGGDTPYDFRKTSRMTLDIQPSNGRRSTSGAGYSSIASNQQQGSSSQHGQGVQEGLVSPRRSLESNGKKGITPRAPSLSLEGRYSLSIPLQSIQE